MFATPLLSRSPRISRRPYAALLFAGCLAACGGGSGGGEDDPGDPGGPPVQDPPRDFDSLVIEPPCPIAGGGFGFTTEPLDWNGDGVLDIAVGAPGEGRIHVLIGGGAAPFQTFESMDRFGPASCPLDGLQTEKLGESLAVGDIDGDGDDEIVAGAPLTAGPVSASAGAVYVYGLSALGTEPYVLTPDNPLAGQFGGEVRLADFDGDGNLDLAVGAPLTMVDGVTAGTVTIIDALATPFESRTEFPNPFPATNGRFGVHLAVDDGNGDGFPDLFVAAIGNTDTNGIALSGQVLGYFGPPQRDGWFVMDDALSLPADFPRFGMYIHAAGGQLLIGAPRKDVAQEQDSGRGYRWDGPSYQVPVLYEHPTALPFDLFGYRVHVADVIGDERMDMCIASLPSPAIVDPNVRSLFIYDGGEASDDPYVLLPLEDSGSHFAVGTSTGDVFGGEEIDLVMGDSRYDRPNTDPTEDSGRVVIYY